MGDVCVFGGCMCVTRVCDCVYYDLISFTIII